VLRGGQRAAQEVFGARGSVRSAIGQGQCTQLCFCCQSDGTRRYLLAPVEPRLLGAMTYRYSKFESLDEDHNGIATGLASPSCRAISLLLQPQRHLQTGSLLTRFKNGTHSFSPSEAFWISTVFFMDTARKAVGDGT
jgi:hypothetical protein